MLANYLIKKKYGNKRLKTEASRRDSSSSIRSYTFSQRMLTDDEEEPLEIFSCLDKNEKLYL